MNLGGTLGIALGGTVFTNKLDSILGSELVQLVIEHPQEISRLPNAAIVVDAVAVSLGFVYYLTIPIAALVLVFGLFVHEFRHQKKEKVDKDDSNTETSVQEEDL